MIDNSQDAHMRNDIKRDYHQIKLLFSHVFVAVLTAFSVSLLPNSHPIVLLNVPTTIRTQTHVQTGIVKHNLGATYVTLVKKSS